MNYRTSAKCCRTWITISTLSVNPAPAVIIDVHQVTALGSKSDGGTSLAMDSPYVRSLLEPFRPLHSMNARVSGRLSAQYKANIEFSITKAASSALKLIDSVSRLIAQGKQASDIGDVVSARSSLYEAIDELGFGHSDYNIDSPTGSEFQKLPAHRVFRLLRFRIYTSLAACFFKLGNFRKSHDCGNAAWQARTVKLILDDAVYAAEVSGLWYCQAMANESVRRIEQALLEIDLALHFLQPSGIAYELELELELRTLKTQIEAQKADLQVTPRLTVTECM